MRTHTPKTPSKESSRQRLVSPSPALVERTRNPTTLPSGSSVLQRKASCACGGGCPRCQENFNLQTKLKLSEPGDRYEQEADRIADEVMRMPVPSVQRQLEPEEEEEEMVQRKGIDNSVASPVPTEESSKVPPIVQEVLNSPGQPLDPETRIFMESRFGHDFSKVRVHTDTKATESAQILNALAYTVGQNIVFDSGHYTPQISSRHRLIAHELTHVLQQEESKIPNIQCQSTLTRPTVPQELLTQPDLSRMREQDLHTRYDQIDAIERRVVEYIEGRGSSAADVADARRDRDQLSAEAGRIGEEFARRNAGAIQTADASRRTFTLDAAQRMKDFFIDNVRHRHLPCINTVREGLSQLFQVGASTTPASVTDALRTTPRNTMEETMARLQVHGLAGQVREIHFLDRQGRRINRGSGQEPISLEENVWDVVIGMVGTDPNYSVFGLSLADGYHSVTLTVDHRRAGRPRIRWSDQTTRHDEGWEEYQRGRSGHPEIFRAGSRRGLDEYIVYAVRLWWGDANPSSRPFPIIRLWRINQPPGATSGRTQSYTVQAGDTLSGIASRFGTTVARLRELNSIAEGAESLIQPEQTLIVPEPPR